MILISGASGRVARRAAELVASPGRALRLMTHTPNRAPQLPGAEVVRGDFADVPSLDAAFDGISTALIVSAEGKPGERARLHADAFQAAARAKVQHIVYLSLQGAGPHSHFPYSRDHFLSERSLAATGIPSTILRNSFYLDMFPDAFRAGVVRGPAGAGEGGFVSREDAAQVAAAVLRSPPGGIYDVTGPELLGVAAIAKRLSALVNRPLRYEDARVEADEALPAWQREIQTGWFEAIAAGELAHLSDGVQRLSGRPPLNLEEYFSASPGLLEPLRR